MRADIISNMDNPSQLEKLYRSNKGVFRREFNLLYPQFSDHKLAGFWNERLNYEHAEISWGTKSELIFVIITSLVAGAIMKLPEFFGISEDFFYPRNAAFIVFPLLTIYFAWKNKLEVKNMVVASLVFLVTLVFINMLPDHSESHTLILACVHLPLLLWAVLGFAFIGGEMKNVEKRLDYLNYNGDLVVITTLVLIAGGLLTGITIGLFSLIGFNIEDFYFKYIVMVGFAASPIVGTYIIQTNPQLVNKVSPVIAKIFSPLVLVTLVIYIIAIIFSGQDPYNDREFLLIFNALLIGVMAIILFALVGTSNTTKSQAGTLILFLLSVMTIIVSVIALSAIIFRIATYGITPNRLAVLGGDALISINLFMVTYQLFRALGKRTTIDRVKMSIAGFLPYYVIWAAIVTFLFPLIFGFN